MAGEVTLRAALARPFLAATNTPQLAYILLEAQPAPQMTQVRMPVNVCFVLDRSGSMKGEKIERLRQAVVKAIEQLDQQDYVAVVIFDHRTEVLIPAQPVRNRALILDLVSRIRDAGGTRIAPAVEKGLLELQRMPQGVRRLILLTDGQTEHEKECLLRADDAGRLGIPITALGIGKDWNEDLLIEMANRSKGVADYIAQPGEIVNYFQHSVQRAQQTVIQQSVLTLRLVQGVTPRAVWQVAPLIEHLGYQPLSDRAVSVNLGELESGQPRALLIELLIEPRPIGTYRIGQAELSYDVPALRLVGEKAKSDIMLTFTTDANQAQQVNPTVMNIVEKVSAFKLQTRALQDLAAGDVRGATQKLKHAVTRLLNQGEVELAATMQQEIANLEQQGQMSSEGQKTIKFQGRKTVRLTDVELPKE